MVRHNLTHLLTEYLEQQLKAWPAAAERYAALDRVQTREVSVGDFGVRLQFNPARAVSASAKVDKASISSRPCFLCSSNRPQEQYALCPAEFRDLGFEILVNPFPIFPKHFTIACVEHQQQDTVDLFAMADIAICLPGMVTFFNGSEAGASAPDHLHLQCGNIDFLPVCDMLQHRRGQLMVSTSDYKAYYPDYLPMEAVHFVSAGMTNQLKVWLDTLLPVCETTGMPSLGKRNLLMWPDKDGLLHTLFLPRRAHRPECYFASEADGHMLVSPGAVDMAGVLILPREKDFQQISRFDIRKIYADVSFPFRESPQFQRLMLQ